MANKKKNLVLTIWGNSEFGCELAYTVAKNTDYRVLLMDLDLLSPKVDLFLKVKKEPEEVLEKDSSLNILMDVIDKNYLTGDIIEKAAVKKRGLKNLYIITGNYNIENFEYYKDTNLTKLIEKSRQSFDIIILLVNRYIYDTYTFTSLICSDINIVPIKADLIEIREINRFIVCLKEKQEIEMEKYKFVAFEYQKHIEESEEVLRELSDNNYYGSIGYSSKRIKFRNGNRAYAARMEKHNQKEYLKLLVKLGIKSKKTIRQIIKIYLKATKLEIAKSIRRIKKGKKLYAGAGNT